MIYFKRNFKQIALCYFKNLLPSEPFAWLYFSKRYGFFLTNLRGTFSFKFLSCRKQQLTKHYVLVCLYISNHIHQIVICNIKIRVLPQNERSVFWTLLCSCLRHLCTWVAGPWISAGILPNENGNWNKDISIEIVINKICHITENLRYRGYNQNKVFH